MNAVARVIRGDLIRWTGPPARRRLGRVPVTGAVLIILSRATRDPIGAHWRKGGRLRIEAVCWDWNGTLLNDVELCLRAMNRVLDEHGCPQIVDVSVYRQVFRFPIRAFYADLGIDPSMYSAAADRFLHLTREAVCRAALQAGARQVLGHLGALGVRQILASATPPGALDEQIRPHHLASVFTDVLSAESPYDASKLDAVANWLAASGTPPERVLMVGDTNHDLEIADVLGIGFVHFTGGHQDLHRPGMVHIDSLPELTGLLGADLGAVPAGW